MRFGQGLDFFDQEAVGRSVFYEDLGATGRQRRPGENCQPRHGGAQTVKPSSGSSSGPAAAA